MAVVPFAQDLWTDYHLVLIHTRVLLVFFPEFVELCRE